MINLLAACMLTSVALFDFLSKTSELTLLTFLLKRLMRSCKHIHGSDDPAAAQMSVCEVCLQIKQVCLWYLLFGKGVLLRGCAVRTQIHTKQSLDGLCNSQVKLRPFERAGLQ